MNFVNHLFMRTNVDMCAVVEGGFLIKFYGLIINSDFPISSLH